VLSPWYRELLKLYRVLHERGLVDRRFLEIVATIDVMAYHVVFSMDRECKRRKTALFR
jgi:hypothetical protein